MNIRFQIDNYVKSTTVENTWSATPISIEAHKISVSNAIGKKDVFNFKIANTRGAAINSIKSLDKIKMYYLINDAATSDSNLIIEGLVKSVKEDLSQSGIILTIEGSSFSDILTGALVFANLPSTNVHSVIQEAINSVNIYNKTFTLNLDMPSTKRDGTAFPTLTDVREFYTSFEKLLDKYLVDGYTGDGSYFYYVSTSAGVTNLVVRPRIGGASTTELYEGVDFKTVKYDVNADDVKNFIVTKCGRDCYNNPITAITDDAVSRAKNGFKFYMLVEGTISQELLTAAGVTGSSRFPASYPAPVTWASTAMNNDDFNKALRDEAKRKGGVVANDYIQAHNKGYRNITINMKPNLDYHLGDKVNITSASYGLTSLPVRVRQIDYDIEGVDITLVEESAVA